MQLASLRDSRCKKSFEEIAADSGSDESGNKTKKKKESNKQMDLFDSWHADRTCVRDRYNSPESY
jgi:hypothetical protein